MNKIINKVTYNGKPVQINTPKSNDVAVSIMSGDIGEEFIDTNGFYTYLAPYCFYDCKNLKVVNLPACISVGKRAFGGTSIGTKFREVRLPNCKYIADEGLGDATIDYLELPNCRSVGTSGLRFNTSMSVLNLPYCEYIGNYGGNAGVVDFIAPNCSYIGSSAFYGGKLSRAIFPKCTTIGSGAFVDCSSLQLVELPKCVTVGTIAFSKCSKLTSVNIPNVLTIANGAFTSCVLLEKLEFSKCSSIGSWAFTGCSMLKYLSIAGGGNVGSNAFAGCSLLSVIVIENKCAIYSSTFNSCPITDSSYLGYYGSVYVPSSLISFFKTSSYWSSISDRITSLDNLPSNI